MAQSITSARPVNRSVRLERTPTAGRPGKVVIIQDGKATSYFVTRLESQIGGIAFRLDKIVTQHSDEDPGVITMAIGERYNVLLDGQRSTCDCKWGVYGANKKACRHVAAMLKLHAEGACQERGEAHVP